MPRRQTTTTEKQLWSLFRTAPLAEPGGKGTMNHLRAQVSLPGDALDFGPTVMAQMRYVVIDRMNSDREHPMGSLAEARGIVERQRAQRYEANRYTYEARTVWGQPHPQAAYRIVYTSGPYCGAFMQYPDREPGTPIECPTHADAEYYRTEYLRNGYTAEVVRLA